MSWRDSQSALRRRQFVLGGVMLGIIAWPAFDRGPGGSSETGETGGTDTPDGPGESPDATDSEERSTADENGDGTRDRQAEDGAEGAGEDESVLERVTPDRDAVEARPGTTVLFEVGLPDGVAPRDVDWQFHDMERDWGDFGLDYLDREDVAATWSAFDDGGPHEVSASVPGEGGAIVWSVTVSNDAPDPPAVTEVITDPGAGETIGAMDPIEIHTTVSDPAGELAQVYWQEGRNMVDVYTASVTGEADEATLQFDEVPLWIEAGYPTLAICRSADGRVSEVVTSEGPTVRPPFEVEIVDTNSPVEPGDPLLVTARVANTGHFQIAGDTTQEIEVAVDGEVVTSGPVTVDADFEETVTAEITDYPTEVDEFTVTVASPDFADEVTVEVATAGDVDDETTDTDESADTDEPDEPTETRLLALITEPEAEFASYRVRAGGPIEPTAAGYQSPSGGEIRGTDVTVREENGTWIAEGLSGGGLGDALAVSGPITEVWIEQPDVMWAELDGQRMSPAEIVAETGG